MIKQYKKKPICVEAVQYLGYNLKEVYDFCKAEGATESRAELKKVSDEHCALFISTLEGDHIACEGSYIIKGVRGEVYPRKKDIFEETYELCTS